jgi:hypothetical protein
MRLNKNTSRGKSFCTQKLWQQLQKKTKFLQETWFLVGILFSRSVFAIPTELLALKKVW